MDLDERIEGDFDAACKEFSLVEAGDRILVGLSGGKDSLTLVHLLSRLREKMGRVFEVVAAHVRFDNLPYVSDGAYLEEFAREQRVEYHLVEDHIRDEHMEHATCLHCSRFRRAKLMELARVLSCNKLALGHHLDDIAATLLMNMGQHGRFGGMAIRLDMTVGDLRYPLTMIRPLCYIAEQDIIEFTASHNYQPVKCRCEWGDTGFRKKSQRAVDVLAAISKDARLNLLRAQFNYHTKHRQNTTNTPDIEDAQT